MLVSMVVKAETTTLTNLHRLSDGVVPLPRLVAVDHVAVDEKELLDEKAAGVAREKVEVNEVVVEDRGEVEAQARVVVDVVEQWEITAMEVGPVVEPPLDEMILTWATLEVLI
jgi:hypothetical protein